MFGYFFLPDLATDTPYFVGGFASLPHHSNATQKPFFTSLNSKSDLTQVFVSCLLARIRLAGTEQSCPGLSGSTLALVLRPLSGCAEWREPVLWVFHLSPFAGLLAALSPFEPATAGPSL